MNTAGVGKIVRVTAAAVAGAIALSGYAGVVGLRDTQLHSAD